MDKEPMICIPEQRYLSLIRIEDEFRRLTSEIEYQVKKNVDSQYHLPGHSWLSILVDEIKRLRKAQS